MLDKLCLINTKTLCFFSFYGRDFLRKITFKNVAEIENFEKKKQKQLDVMFLCAPGGGRIFIF